mmetsp:Transcript_99443/g.279551  ORF Transcript_99443/g.279551 Transcript_99443/m.279551 type:complete len:352 (+) Transcript_99443:161-1216(+)
MLIATTCIWPLPHNPRANLRRLVRHGEREPTRMSCRSTTAPPATCNRSRTHVDLQMCPSIFQAQTPTNPQPAAPSSETARLSTSRRYGGSNNIAASATAGLRPSQFGVDVIHVPIHGLALESVLQRPALGHIPSVEVPRLRHFLVEVLQVVSVEPHQSGTLLIDDYGLPMHDVRVSRAEDMPDARARHHLDAATASPSPQGHLDVLATPLRHVGVIGSGAVPEIAPHGQNASGQRWRGVRLRVAVRLVALFDQGHPIEGQGPIEASDVVVRNRVLIEVLLRDYVQNWHDHGAVLRARERQPLQKRLCPLPAHDAMRLHEYDRGAVDEADADDLRADQSLALFVPVDADLRM